MTGAYRGRRRTGIRWGPRVRRRIVPIAMVARPHSSPHDHLAAGPDRCMPLVTVRQGLGLSWDPGVARRIVAASGIEIYQRTRKTSSPDDHLVAGPHGRVAAPPAGSTQIGSRADPGIGQRVVAAAGAQAGSIIVEASPD